LGGPRARELLALLLLNPNRPLSSEYLVTAMWGDSPSDGAATTLRSHVGAVRRVLASAGAGDALGTRAGGYLLALAPADLDAEVFAGLVERAQEALGIGDPAHAAALLGEALALWRGDVLSDLGPPDFADAVVARLGELRLAAEETAVAAALALGQHREVVGRLQELVAAHPFHERLCGQLMLALYRSGRQAEALDVYRSTRERLVETFGLDPGAALQALERAILDHEPSLELTVAPGRDSGGSILAVASGPDGLDALFAVAEPLGALPGREVILVCLLEDDRDLERTAAAVRARRESLAAPTRSAVFTTPDPPGDVVRLANANDVGFVLLDAPAGLDGDRLPDELAAILERSPAAAGVLSARAGESAGADVFVPFGGGEHDWAALELGAWLASASGASLDLVGTKSESSTGRRDASRLLADASLAVQRVVGVETRPVLAEPTEDALVAAVEKAGLVVVGISARWRGEGIGATRRALVRRARPPVLLVHRGMRPSILAPREARTRFTWTLES
jgi:DNA-binding SARP family transcriptional activator